MGRGILAVLALLLLHLTAVAPSAGLQKTTVIVVRAQVAQTCALSVRLAACRGAFSPQPVVRRASGDVTVFEF